MIPESIIRSDDYIALSDKQRANFSGRLDHVAELISSVDSYVSDGGLNKNEIDDIELDASAIMSIMGSPEFVSPWLVHSSWTFLCKSHVMSMYLPILDVFLREPKPHFNSDMESLTRWLRTWVNVSNEILDDLKYSRQYDVAIAQLIGIDILIYELLTVCAILRFNPCVCD